MLPLGLLTTWDRGYPWRQDALWPRLEASVALSEPSSELGTVKHDHVFCADVGQARFAVLVLNRNISLDLHKLQDENNHSLARDQQK